MEDDDSHANDLEIRTDDSDVDDSEGSSLINRQEIKLLNVVRVIVTATMFTVAFITSSIVFIVGTIREEHIYESTFKMDSEKLIKAFHEKIDLKMKSAKILSSDMTLYAQSLDDSQQQWPYITFPEFEYRCLGHREITQASAFTYAPLLEDPAQIESWEEYAVDAFAKGQIRPNYAGFIDTVNDAHQGGHLPPPPHDDDDHDAGILYHETELTIKNGVYQIQNGRAEVDFNAPDDGYVFPLWQRAPNNNFFGFNFDQMSNQIRAGALQGMMQHSQSFLTDILLQDSNGTDYAYYASPHSTLYYPIYSRIDSDSIVGALGLEFRLEDSFKGVLEDPNKPISVVLSTSCGQNVSFNVVGEEVHYLGVGDWHEHDFGDEYIADSVDPVSTTYESYAELYLPGDDHDLAQQAEPHHYEDYCSFRITTYPTFHYHDAMLTSAPEQYRWIVLFLFMFTISVFIVYDCLVERHERKMVESAVRTNQIVASLFPSNVRDRLFKNNAAKKKKKKKGADNEWFSTHEDPDNIEGPSSFIDTPGRRLASFLHISGGGGKDEYVESESLRYEPIADFFPNTTVLFADISGFTAWASERDPSQVFTLLETLYQAMDKAAKRFNVFKVETIGDCYVAATGIPNPEENHAELMMRFARLCLVRNAHLAMTLEATLGPGTADLSMRVGIHSGAVTAGVLRGEKSRFQLFGDTMNTASRMEATGVSNKVHLSKDTAELLISRGKAHWVTPREELVSVKGKGDIQTFWLQLGTSSTSRTGSYSSGSYNGTPVELIRHQDGESLSSFAELLEDHGVEQNPMVGISSLDGVVGQTNLNKALLRLVDWNTEVLLKLLEKVYACRQMQVSMKHIQDAKNNDDPEIASPDRKSFLDEVEMVIPLPSYQQDIAEKILIQNSDDIDLPIEVKAELRSYVGNIASGYRRNAFHNFEHASHVILSATKLLKRIIMPNRVGPDQKEDLTTKDVYMHSYGISSDPLTQFAVVFSALIHDVGHTGVPNGQLAKESPALAEKYVHRCVAEQRSIDVALELLMLPEYKNLQNCLYSSEQEQKRFRQLLVNSVMATDIFDKELKILRNSRWDKAFHGTDDDKEDGSSLLLGAEDMNRKATIVIEHIIQASDVSHTMQHWHIYQKWNERLFREMYSAYLLGRVEKDPSVGWYEGELWFFDNYVIPLARKLEECGVFGVSSDEYLTYALQNRGEWERRGKEVCETMIRRFHSQKKTKSMRRGGVEMVVCEESHAELDEEL